MARYVTPGRDYVGLRQQPEDAVERARLNSTTPVGRATHILLRTIFSATGFARYATLSTDKTQNFAPVLYKKIYNDSTCDWQVWRFHGDLPLAVFENGHALIASEWVELACTAPLVQF